MRSAPTVAATEARGHGRGVVTRRSPAPPAAHAAAVDDGRCRALGDRPGRRHLAAAGLRHPDPVPPRPCRRRRRRRGPASDRRLGVGAVRRQPRARLVRGDGRARPRDGVHRAGPGLRRRAHRPRADPTQRAGHRHRAGADLDVRPEVRRAFTPHEARPPDQGRSPRGRLRRRGRRTDPRAQPRPRPRQRRAGGRAARRRPGQGAPDHLRGAGPRAQRRPAPGGRAFRRRHPRHRGAERVGRAGARAVGAGRGGRAVGPHPAAGPRDDRGRPSASDLRDLDVADLLGRQPVELDTAAIAEHLAGRRILVTGAGGSIGSELCRQIAQFLPEQLFMLDRDESGLHATQMSIEGRALLDSDELVLCDIRDEEELHAVFARTRPDVVFHAAALKHLTMLERHPAEAFKTNVLGTRNVLRAARKAGVSTVVNISTDKAANPTCVLGWSKRVAERLTAAVDADEPGARYLSVRFGNVLGSRGSVVVAFTEQIRQGGPVTVTHPDVERYFMLIPEACQLVLQASSIGEGGEVMVLDMGTPVKIDDVARSMIQMSGRSDVEVEYTGLRPGEKLTEELFSPDEDVRPSSHPLITSVAVPGLDQDDLQPPHPEDDPRSWLVAYSALGSVGSRQ
ncbi:polysaccharide biosynthesis protein [Phycicoccus endophyticus]|uniref:Polysaccharide biosynthesis protein n=1 Tax=Phycicoccus endophyticus TaxID=1690220 RepID=A0A7G9R2U3_9MICO|nr:polysaccharide biosynthesis protein [Phycicoccus endophyticus]